MWCTDNLESLILSITSANIALGLAVGFVVGQFSLWTGKAAVWVIDRYAARRAS